MITRIQVKNFKSLKSVDLKLGWFNLFVGENASGKSNFLEVLRVLQGIGNGLTVDEIFNGKAPGSTNVKWSGIRGGSSRAGFTYRDASGKVVRSFVDLTIDLELQDVDSTVKYDIRLSPVKARVISETLTHGGRIVYGTKSEPTPSSRPTVAVRYPEAGRRPLTFERSRPIAGQLLAGPQLDSDLHTTILEQLRNTLGDCQSIDPSPEALRAYTLPQRVERLGEQGENLAGLIDTIRADEQEFDAYISWLKKLTPTEFDDIRILEGAVGDRLLAMVDRGIEFPAPVLSDGTLRFAAITAAFFQPVMPDHLLIEEIDKGLHPTRIRLIVQLLRRRSKDTDTQVFATTHSPTVLDWLREEDYPTAFVCRRDDETGESRITPLSEIPRLAELRAERVSLGELFAKGWMETVP